MRRIVAEGHGVCNHTLTHPEPFARRPAAEIDRQVAETQAAIGDAAGLFPHLFRSPGRGMELGGLRHGRAPRPSAHRLGYRPTRLGPTRGRHNHPAVLRAKPGDILLCHDGGGDRAQTYTALTRVLPQLKGRGLSFVYPLTAQPGLRRDAPQGNDRD